MVAVYFSPRRVYTSESVRQAVHTSNKVWIEITFLVIGVLGDCPLLYISDTAWLGQAHGHRKLAAGVWRGDGPFRYELPNKIPFLEANSTSQMEEVGG